jgi:phenylacetic acid degradation protein
MANIFEFQGITPVVDPDAYVHPNATLIGDVIIGPGTYIAPSAVLRGDFGRIIIERGANIQDGCIVHGSSILDTTIEEDGHIGHGAILHTCIIRRGALVGINAVVMDEAEVGELAIVAAMSFVKAGDRIPPRTLAAGIPAKVRRELTESDMAHKAEGTTMYHENNRHARATMKVTEALTEIEPGRRRTQWETDAKPLYGMGKDKQQSGA